MQSGNLSEKMTTPGYNITSTLHFAFDGEEENTLISDETAILVLRILAYGVTPVISAFGIAGNVLNIMILRRHGLHKCSNILLATLAFADIGFLVSFNGFPKLLHDIEGHGRFLYSKDVSFAFYIGLQIFNVLDYAFGICGLTIPCYITLERFIAVYFPLQMPRIVTPARTWTALIILVIYDFGMMTYTCFWSTFEYGFDPELNATVYKVGRSALFDKDKILRRFIEEVIISVKIQPIVTFIGCLFIIVKVKIMSIKRRKMSGNTKQSSVSKTTQTLMSVCVVYLFVSAVLALPSFLPENVVHYSVSSSEQFNLGLIMYQVINIVICMNSSWNFLIYTALNKNFRDTLKDILNKYTCCSFQKNGS